MSKVTQETKQPVDLIVDFLSNVQYQDGAVKKFNEISPVLNDLYDTHEYSQWLERFDLLGYCMSEAQRVEADYNGTMPVEDCRKLADHIHTDLKNFPLSYVFYFELPSGLKLEDEVVITSDIKIVSMDNKIIEEIDEKNVFTYRRYDFSLYTKKGKNNTKPNYLNLKNEKTYLKINAKGLVSNNHIVTEGIDPFHVYKILIAYMHVTSIIRTGDLLYMIFDVAKATHGKNSLVYKDNLQFVSDISRPYDESENISKLVFDKEIASNISKLTTELKVFSKLIVKMNNTYLDQERNKIINSLYWYFESITSSNNAFRTMLSVSMFDSFYTNDYNKDKFKSILKEYNVEAKYNKDSPEWLALENLYKDRNDIGHGNVHLLEVDKSNKDRKHLILTPTVSAQMIYVKFLISKIEKLLT